MPEAKNQLMFEAGGVFALFFYSSPIPERDNQGALTLLLFLSIGF